MSEISLQEFVTVLCHVVTPANQKPSHDQINLTTFSLGAGISKDIIEKNQLPEDTAKDVGNLITSILMSGSICFGYTKQQYENTEIQQVIFSSNACIQYYKIIDIFMSIIPSFLTNFLNATMETVQKKQTEDYFQKIVQDFIQYNYIFQYWILGADLEQQFLPPDFGVPKLKDQIQDIFQKSLKVIEEGDRYRAMKAINQPADEQETIFAKSIQDLNDQTSKFRQVLALLQKKINDNFDTLFIEQPYIDWQLYCKNFSEIVFQISVLCYEISKYDPTQYLTVVKILIQFSNYAFLTYSPYTQLIRFRGNFEEFTKKSKEAHEKLGTIFAPLLQAIIGILPKCPQPFTEFCKSKITSLFQDIQRLHEEYNSRTEALVAALKADRRFSVFMKSGLQGFDNPEITEAIKGALDILLKIVSQFLRQKSPINEISENLNKFNQEYSTFNTKFHNLINSASNLDEKIRYVQQRDSYASAFDKLASSIQILSKSPTNDLIRTQTGIVGANLLLALCNLDPNRAIIETLNSLRPIVSENVVQFIPANTKTLLDLLTLINNRASDLPQTAREIFLGLFPTSVSLIRESATIFSSNPDPNNPKNIGNCLHEYDKLHPLLYSLYESLNVQDIPSDLQGATQLLSIFASNIKNSSLILRNTYQIYITHLMKAYRSQSLQFIDYFLIHASKKDEQYYKTYSESKEKSDNQLKLLEAELLKEPPFGVFDYNYLKISIAKYSQSISVVSQTFALCNEIMKIMNPPMIIKQTMSSIASISKILNTLSTFVNELYVLNQLPILSLLGPLFDLINKSTTDNITKLAEALQSNNGQVSILGNNLADSLNELINLLGYDKMFESFAPQIPPIVKQIIPATAAVTLGKKDEIPQLASVLQAINNLITGLQPIFQAHTEQLKALGKKKADELAKPTEQPQDPNIPVFPKGPGFLVDPKTGEKYPGLLIDQIPDSSMIDKLFMNAMQSSNDQMKNLLNNYVNAVKKDVDEFLPLFAEYQRNPTPELLAKLNALGSRIVSNLKAYQDCLNFNPDTTTEDHLKDLLTKFQDLPSASKALSAPELLLNTIAFANNKLKSPQQLALINAEISDILKNLIENPDFAYKQLELLTKALIAEDPSTVLDNCLKEVRNDLQNRDAQKTAIGTKGLVFMDRLSKILAGQPIPVISEGSLQSNLLITSQKIQDENKITDEMSQALSDLLNVFEESIAAFDETDNVNEKEIPDKVMDLNNEVMELGVAIQNDLKKSPLDLDELQKKLNSIKSKSLDVAGLTSLIASRRQELDKDTNEQLQEETSKVFDSLKALEDAINSCKGNANARNAQRQVQKANRELNASLGALSDVIEAIIDKPSSTIEPNNNDYNSYGNILQNQLVKLASLLQESGEDRSSNKFKLNFKKIMKQLNDSLDKFRTSTGIVVKGTDEEPEIMKQVAELEKLLKDNLINPEKIDQNLPQEGFQMISDIRHAIGDALSTEVVAQPKAVSSLPFRYSVPTTSQQSAPASTQELLPLIEAAIKNTQDNLQSFTSILNNAKSGADSITNSMSSFHGSVSNLIDPLDRMIASTWNPQSQNLLSQARSALISSADYSIDATRNRLLGTEGWRDDISSFNLNATDSINQVLLAARKAFESAQADLSVTNEAERELVKAAQSVAESQKRLASMKSVAQEKKITSGEGYLGLDIIDISAPILSTAAKLIETAQAQTRFLLKRDPNLTNTKGLVKTANDLVESLTLITVAAECTVNNEPDCISKVLAAANLVSSSAQHFLAEVYQKNGSPDLNATMESITGSIQGLVKQLRTFGEAAQRQETERNAASSLPKVQKLSSMIEKLNAEAKVVEARRALEEAELKLKKTRLENK